MLPLEELELLLRNAVVEVTCVNGDAVRIEDALVEVRSDFVNVEFFNDSLQHFRVVELFFRIDLCVYGSLTRPREKEVLFFDGVGCLLPFRLLVEFS